MILFGSKIYHHVGKSGHFTISIISSIDTEYFIVLVPFEFVESGLVVESIFGSSSFCVFSVIFSSLLCKSHSSWERFSLLSIKSIGTSTSFHSF